MGRQDKSKPDDDGQKLHLIEALSKQRDRLGSWLNVEAAIREETKVVVDRRKLKHTVDGLDVSFRVSELRALDTFLAPFGDGLVANPIFEQSAILAEIAQGSNVAFLLGSLPRQGMKRVDISHWDVRSMIDVLRRLDHYDRMRIDIEQAVYGKSLKQPLQNVDHEAWFQRLSSDRDSLVCFGSSRVNPATEVMLAQMFGVKPFDPTGGNVAPLPFRFIWPRDRGEFMSSFELAEEQVRESDPDLDRELAKCGADVMGICVGETLIPVRRRGNKWRTYGVIVAQRRANGRIWLVLAGLDGTSTFGATSEVWRVVRSIPRAEKGQHSAVQWMVVESSVVADPKLSGDKRVIEEQEISHGPYLWSPPAECDAILESAA